LVVGEAKGGYRGKGLDDILNIGYGYRQGSIEWAGSAANATLLAAQPSTGTTTSTTAPATPDQDQVDAAHRYLDAIANGGAVRIDVYHAECVSNYPKKSGAPMIPITAATMMTTDYHSDKYP
jgi:hypothetical protein